MDEALEVVDVLADSGFEGAIVWFLRLVGLLVVFAGLGLWLVGESGLLVLPGALLVVGIALMIVPGLLLTLVELLT